MLIYLLIAQRGDVTSELQAYFDMSEQRPAVVHLEASVLESGIVCVCVFVCLWMCVDTIYYTLFVSFSTSVTFSGGLLMEVMPSSDEIDEERQQRVLAEFRTRMAK